MHEARRLAGEGLARALRDSRARLLSLVDDLSEAQWQVPRQEGVNPIAWELAHVAWFAEFWILRGPHRVGDDGLVYAARAALHAGPDERLDSARLPHAARWTVEWPARTDTFAMMAAQLAACLQAIPTNEDDGALYAHRLALFHEDMHAEAFAWLRAALGYPAPEGARLPRFAASAALRVPGGAVRIGWPAGEGGFAFDNEQPALAVELEDFGIDAAPVTNARFLDFVEDGGYRDAHWWSPEGAAWLARHDRQAPVRWRRDAPGRWRQRWFDRWVDLDPQEPVIHVNAYEAEAYACWAGRRLPRACEWEHAATSAGDDFRWGGSVWEWTADAFEPYPGFRAGPYKDYSAPWFGNHRELRGAAWATQARLRDPRYRNFFLPHRSDVFAGFRTAARRP